MKVLGQTKIEILKALKKRDKTLSELSKELGLSKATLFRHLAILRNEGIVKRIENGNKFVYYRLSQKGREILEVAISGIVALAGAVIAYLSAHMLSVSESRLSTPPTLSITPTSPAVPAAPSTPKVVPTITPMPAGGFIPGFIPKIPDVPKLPELQEIQEIGRGADVSGYCPISPMAAAVLAFLFIFMIVLVFMKLLTVKKKT